MHLSRELLSILVCVCVGWGGQIQFFFLLFNSCSFLFLGHDWLTTDLGGSGGALALLEEEKRLRPPAVNKVDLPTDGLNDREAN